MSDEQSVRRSQVQTIETSRRARLPHAFMVTSETARVLALQTPGTGEAFYRDAGEPIESAEDASRPADWARLREVAEQSESIQLLGPPPFEAELQKAAGAPS